MGKKRKFLFSATVTAAVCLWLRAKLAAKEDSPLVDHSMPGLIRQNPLAAFAQQHPNNLTGEEGPEIAPIAQYTEISPEDGGELAMSEIEVAATPDAVIVSELEISLDQKAIEASEPETAEPPYAISNPIGDVSTLAPEHLASLGPQETAAGGANESASPSPSVAPPQATPIDTKLLGTDGEEPKSGAKGLARWLRRRR